MSKKLLCSFEPCAVGRCGPRIGSWQEQEQCKYSYIRGSNAWIRCVRSKGRHRRNFDRSGKWSRNLICDVWSWKLCILHSSGKHGIFCSRPKEVWRTFHCCEQGLLDILAISATVGSESLTTVENDAILLSPRVANRDPYATPSSLHLVC